MALSVNDAFSARRRSRRGRRGRATLSEINVTPLVDVMLVLLIIFMISAPLLTAGVKVELPKTEAGSLQDESQPVTITVQADGSLYLSETAIRLGDLRTALETIAKSDGMERPIYVRADGRAPYAVVAQAMAVLSTSGFTHINLITDTGKVEGQPPGAGRMTVIQPMEAPRRRGLSGAMAGSVLLHLALVGAGYLALHWAHPLHIGPSVAVTLVASGPENLRRADQAPDPVEAATPDPVAEATPAPVAPPTPAPPAPSPARTQADRAASPPAKAPTPKAVAPTRPGLDLDALAAQLTARAGSGRAASSAPRGPAQVATAVRATPAVGAATSLTASALSALASELNRRWNPNCEVEGGQDVNVKVTFRLGAGGVLVGQPAAVGSNGSDPIVQAATDRAIRAVHDAAPFATLPPELFGQTFSVNFDARKACVV